MKKIYLLIVLMAIQSAVISQNALNFDGSNDYVLTSYPGISGSAARTVEAWIKTTAIFDPNSGGTQGVITDWGATPNGQRFTFNVLWNNGIRLEVAGNGLSGSIPVNDGNWHHVAAVYNPAAANTVSLYVDGVLDISGNLTVGVNTATTNNLMIGKRIDNVKYFNGSIDEVRVWNTARSQAQIQAAMNTEFCNSTSGLVAYYTFDEGIANGSNSGNTTLLDLSGNANHGTLNSFTLSGTASNWVNGAPVAPGMSTSYETITACDQYIWPATGQTLSAGGIYTATTQNYVGCDSLITLDLTIDAPNDVVQTATACDDFTWSVNGQTYSTSTYIDTVLSNQNGCTYHHVLDLTINNSYATTASIVSCEPNFTWINGITYSAPTNTPIYIYTTALGCDSVVTLDLTFESINTNVINNDPTLVADQFGTLYQWIDCDNNNAPIAGATSQSFTPTQNGNYAVILSSTSCTDTSACYTVATVSLDEIQLEDKQLIKVTDLLGRETTPQPNTPLLYIYSDGTIVRTFKVD